MRIVSLINRFLISGSLRDWFRNTTSSFHRRFILALLVPCCCVSGFPWRISSRTCWSVTFRSSSSLRSRSSSRSCLIFSSSRISSASSSSSALHKHLLLSTYKNTTTSTYPVVSLETAPTCHCQNRSTRPTLRRRLHHCIYSPRSSIAAPVRPFQHRPTAKSSCCAPDVATCLCSDRHHNIRSFLTSS